MAKKSIKAESGKEPGSGTPGRKKSSDKVKRSGSTPRHSKKSIKEKAREKIDLIGKIIGSLDEQEVPIELFEAVGWLVERGHEDMIYDLIESEQLDQETSELLAFILRDTAYRHPIITTLKSPDGKVEHRQAEMIPFGIVFAIAVREMDLRRIPQTLPKTIERAAEARIFRRACGLGEGPSVLIDSRLYHLDHIEWTKESAVQAYLRGWFGHLTGSDSSIQPLSPEYGKRSTFDPDLYGQEQNLSDRYCLLARVMCAIAIIDDEDEDLEKRLFDEVDGEELMPDQRQAWDELEDLILDELRENGIGAASGVFLYPQAIELDEVPHTGLLMYRMIPLQKALENSLDELLASAPEGVAINPLLYVSQHGDQNIEEIRLAAYTGGRSDPFFCYTWEIDPLVDDVEDVTEIIIDVASKLQAKIVTVEGLLANDRCQECGEPT
jgi:hypothetical protein